MLEGVEILYALSGGCGVPEPGKIACSPAMGVSSLRNVIACSSEEREKFRRKNENVYWTMIYHLIPLFV